MKIGLFFLKKDNGNDLLLSNFKKRDVPVKRLSLEPHLRKWYKVDIENIPQHLFITPDVRLSLVGEVLDRQSPKKNQENSYNSSGASESWSCESASCSYGSCQDT